MVLVLLCIVYSSPIGPMKITQSIAWKTKLNLAKTDVKGPSNLIQLNPALMNFRGLSMSFCYRRISVIANKGNKRNHEFASVIGGIPLVASPLERGSTVCCRHTSVIAKRKIDNNKELKIHIRCRRNSFTLEA